MSYAGTNPINEYPIPVSVGGTGTCSSTGAGKNVLSTNATLDSPQIFTPTIDTLTATGTFTTPSLIINNVSTPAVLGVDATQTAISYPSTGSGNVVLSDGATINNATLTNPNITLLSTDTITLNTATPNTVLVADSLKRVVSNIPLTPGEVVETDSNGLLTNIGSTGTGLVVRQDDAVINAKSITATSDLVIPNPPQSKLVNVNPGGRVISEFRSNTRHANLELDETTSDLSIVLWNSSTNFALRNFNRDPLIVMNNATGQLSFPIGTVNPYEVLELDGSKNLRSRAITGTGNVVLENNATLTSPSLVNPTVTANTVTMTTADSVYIQQGTAIAKTKDLVVNTVGVGTTGVADSALHVDGTMVTAPTTAGVRAGTTGSGSYGVQLTASSGSGASFIDFNTTVNNPPDYRARIITTHSTGDVIIENKTVGGKIIFQTNSITRLIIGETGTITFPNFINTVMTTDGSGNIIGTPYFTPQILTITTPGAGTLTGIPAGTRYMQILCTGGGGGAGDYNDGNVNSSSGGGGSVTTRYILNYTGQPIDYIVGAKGTWSDNNDGTKGGNSLVNVNATLTLFSPGGNGSVRSTAGGPPGQPGDTDTGTTGEVIHYGGKGGYGGPAAWHRGGHGGSSYWGGNVSPDLSATNGQGGPGGNGSGGSGQGKDGGNGIIQFIFYRI